jgi:adenosylhomocysteine nucleosidase
MNTFVLCAAIPQEVQIICKRLSIQCPSKSEPVTSGIYKQCTIKVLTSGVGKDRMNSILSSREWIGLHNWISIGFAGGLDNSYKIGDVLSGNQVCLIDQDVYRSDSLIDVDNGGKLFCSEKIIETSSEKRELFQKTNAVAVDMESIAVCTHAISRNEPFGWIRVISDSATENINLDIVENTIENGYPSTQKAIQFLLLNPWKIVSLIQLGQRSQLSSKRLSEGVISFLDYYITSANS